MKRKLTLSFIWSFSVVFLLMGNANAQEVNVQYSTNSQSDHKIGSYLYSEDLSKNATININKKTGFIIKELYWANENGVKLRDVKGDWSGKSSFSGTDTITGTELMVRTTESQLYGGIYYWDRSGGTNLWRATGDGFVRDSSDPACPSPGVFDEWDYQRYPNCTDSGLSLTVKNNSPYLLGGLDGNHSIPAKAIRMDTLMPVDVRVDKDLEIPSLHNTFGKTDDKTTSYLGTYSALTKSSVRVNFRQTFGQYAVSNRQYKDWANPGARQMWWYSAFQAKFQAMTYRYLDKMIIVEWQSEDELDERTTINVRHIVRTGPTGSYQRAAENIIPQNKALPYSQVLNAEAAYGKVVGSNVYYNGYGGTVVQSGQSITASLTKTQKTAYVTFMYEKEEPKFTGDFDIVPGTINYRESFSFVPKNFVMNGCVYQSHRYKIERDGTFTSAVQTGGQSQSTSYSYANYPWIIGVGTHIVSINIKTDCGETGWINPKPLVVNDMAGNNPPQFQIGFVYPTAQTVPIYKVVEGTVLNLIYIDDPSVPTPTDPDGDTLYFMGFDTEGSISNFIRELPSKYAHSEYQNGYHRITMDTVGYHYVTAQMRDQWGATATASTWIQVVPRNPVAVPEGPAKVKSGRPVKDSEFTSTKSYSPVGRKIDHTRDEWTNKEAVYWNETEENIFEKVELHVYDNVGLKSLEPGIHTIIVEPDLPPIAKLDVPALAVRNQETEIINRSYSPDGDELVKIEYKYKYDGKNNGFDDDEWIAITGEAKVLPFKPAKVGKYLFYVKVTEDYGKSDDTLDEDQELLVLDVVNDAPTISFDMEGKNEQPDLEPLDPYKPADILSKWQLYQVNSKAALPFSTIKWFANGNVLAGSTGKEMERQNARSASNNSNGYSWIMPFANNGFGDNSLSPYRAIANPDRNKTQLLLDVTKGSNTNQYAQPFDNLKIVSNEAMFYFNNRSTSYYSSNDDYKGVELFAYNKSKAGNFQSNMVMSGNSPSWVHSYPDGDPVEFRLTPSSLFNQMSNYNYYHYPTYQDFLDKTNGEYRGTARIRGFNILWNEVADRTIYQYVSVTFSRTESQRDSFIRNGRLEYASDSGADLRTYDAFTGELIASTLEKGTKAAHGRTYAKGDNLVVFSGTRYEERNRQGDTVGVYTLPDLQIPIPSNEFALSTKVQEYRLGEIYILSELYMKNGWGQRTYLSKVNSDYTLAWTTELQGAYGTKVNTYEFNVGSVQPSFPHLVFNPMKDEVLVNTFSPNGFGTLNHYQRVSMSNGSVSTWDTAPYGVWSSQYTGFQLDWDGNFIRTASNSTYFPRTRTADGWSTGGSGNSIQYFNPTGTQVGSNNTSFTLWMNMMFAAANVDNYNGLYVGDGMYISFTAFRDAYNYQPGYNIPVLSIGQPTSDPLLFKAFTLGQFVSDNKLANAEIGFGMTLHQPKTNTDLAGMSFRMQDPENRYAVETDGQRLYLAKYTGGNRTVLGSQHFPVKEGRTYAFRIMFQGEAIKVYMDGVPYFDVTDSQYSDGYFGMFADRGLVDFTKIGSKELPDPNVWDTQYAIWEEDDAAATIRTDNVIFEDPEDDPIAKLDWSIFHTVRFINNQGLSALHGQSITEGELKLDAVGDYKVALRGKDDPHPDFLMPDETFGEYRKDSNEFVRMITVHRRPIAQFDVEQRDKDGQVIWTDSSFDPDRYESATHYSDEDTGIDYKATKGIMEKRFYYITPSGNYVPEKLITPQEKGTYEIGLAVKDEYGAWSHWAVRMLDIDKLPPPNAPPVPGFTKSHTTTYRGVNVTIDSTAYDLEDGDRTTLPHTYYVRNKTSNGTEAIRSTSRTNWMISFDQLGTYNIRQLVQDSHGATAKTEQEISIVNRKPVANITYPTSTNQNNPTKVTVLRPEFTWTYSDADNDAQARYQVQIYRYGGSLILDSGSQNGVSKSWTAHSNLPEHTNMYVQVRVHDGYDWSDWSTVRYFYIETNQPPTADFTWSPQPVYEGDTVQFVSNVSDPDMDTLSAVYELTDPKGSKTTFNYTLQPTGSTYPTTGPTVRMLEIGNWTMRLTVSDGKAAPVVVTKTVRVLELTITGQVTHTDEWEKNRLNWNNKNPGNERSSSTFWAGERFVLTAQATNTGSSPTKATRVEVRAVDIGRTTLQSNDTVNWSGYIGNEQAEKSLEKLANGPYDFVFTVTYNNGIIKSTTVRINILGHWSQYFKLHHLW